MNIRRNKMALSTLLKLQLIYCIFGIGYNIVSYYLLMSGGRPLSSNSPIIGGLAMFAYGFCLISAQKGFYKIYRLLMVLFLVIFGYAGLAKHFVIYAQQPEAYASFSAWLIAIVNNLFGFLLNFVAAANRFESNSTKYKR